MTVAAQADVVEPRRTRWPILLLALGIHLGSILGIFYFSWSAVAVCLLLGWVSCGLGITLGWHRLLTHRSYQTFKPIEYFLTVLGCLGWQLGPIEWVGTHRLHHAHTDERRDPHSPRVHDAEPNGGSWLTWLSRFWWAHIGWAFVQNDFDPRATAKDLVRDPIMVWIDRLYFVPGLILAGLLYFLGERLAGPGEGMAWMVWGIFVRTMLLYHATWFVNSASHVWGYRNFKTDDDSTNLWWVALVSFGEGWHNNHHAQQNSAAHGMRWWEFDQTWLTIRLMRMLGLSWNVVEPDLSKAIKSEPR
ncbi:MAG: fatty acid desaturase [Planctomycetota bacterium]|nr:fatty acid desaturase [Planctomycetota bacterium]